MGVKVLTQKRTVIITIVLFWGNTFTPMGLHSSGYGNLSFAQNLEEKVDKVVEISDKASQKPRKI